MDDIELKGWFDDITDDGVGQTSYERKLAQGYTKEEIIMFRLALKHRDPTKRDPMLDVPCKCTEYEFCDRCRMLSLREEYGNSPGK